MFRTAGSTLALIATLSLSLPMATPLRAQDAGGGLDPDTAERLEEMGDVLRDLADVVGEEADILSATLAMTGADAAAIVDHMGAGVAYAPYTGALNGAVGTLRMGAGNSYDQALTLVTLLKQAGFQGQMLVGPVGSDAPYSTTRRPVTLPDRSEEIAELSDELAEIAAELGDGDLAAPSTLAEDRITLDPALAAQAARQAGDVLGAVPAPPLAEAPDLHAVVRFRALPSDPWRYADPARAQVMDDLDTSALTILNDTIPKEHLHLTQIAVHVESDTFGSVPVARAEFTSANLGDKPVGFALVPSDRVFAPDEPPSFAPDQSLLFLSDQLGSFAVSLQGQVVPLDVAASGMGAVFQTGSGLLGDAMAALGSDEGTAKKALFDRIVMDVTTRAPMGGATQSARRVLVDRAAVDLALSQAGGTVDGYEGEDAQAAALLAASFSNAQLYAGTTPRLEGERGAMTLDVMSRLIAGLSRGPENRAIAEGGSGAIADILQDELASLFVTGDGPVPHRAPSVAMLRSAQLPGGDGAQGVLGLDILLDGRAQAGAAAAAEMAVAAAGEEARLIGLLTRALGHDASEKGSYEHLAAALEAGTAPVALDAYLAELPDPAPGTEAAAHLAFLTAEQEAGKRIAVWPSDDIRAVTWLELDPAAGTARLASGLGGGQDTVEELLLNINIALYVTVANLANCAVKADKAKPGETDKCLTCAVAKFGLAMIGMGTLGFGAAAALGASTVGTEVACL